MFRALLRQSLRSALSLRDLPLVLVVRLNKLSLFLRSSPTNVRLNTSRLQCSLFLVVHRNAKRLGFSLNKNKRRLLELIAIAGVVLAPNFAQAIAVQGIGVSPTSQEINLQPGDTYHSQLTVINDGASTIIYHLYAADYKVTNEQYVGNFDSSGAAANISPIGWVQLPASQFTIKSGQQIVVQYTITAPNTATIGGHYTAIFAETVPPPNPGGTRIARVDRVGSLLYLAVGGQLHPAGQVLPLDAHWLQPLSPITAGLRIHNTGNVHFVAYGTAWLSGLFGGQTKPAPFKGEVLPGTIRRFGLKLPTAAPIGVYKLTAEANFNGQTVTQSHWVVLLPRLTFIIIGLTILLMAVLAIWDKLLRHRGRR